MKKLLALIMSVLLLISISSTVFASNGEISVYLDDIKIEFDVQPIIKDGRTLVPMRKIFEAMGATVLWDDATSTVTANKNDTIINLTIGSNVVFKNGIPIAIDVPAQLVDGRTLVPVRVVSESLGCNVEWIGTTNTVAITSNYSTTGNTNNNLANGGNFAYSNGWVYCYKDSGLYKMKPDGSSSTLLSKEYCQSINVVGDWVYYVSGDKKIVKIKNDGTQRTVLDWIDIAQYCMVISNNIMYYLDNWGGLFSVNLDGTNTTRIGNFNTLFFQVEDDWIYYNPEISPSGLTHGNICRIKTDGTQQSKILDSSTYDFNVVDGWIYYYNAEYQNWGVFKARTDGSGKKLIIKSNTITDISVIGNNIYYFSYYDLYTDPMQGELRKTNLDGEKDTFVKKCEYGIASIGAFENMVAYNTYDNLDFDIISLDAESVETVKNGFGTLYDIFGKREYEGELKDGQPHGTGTAFYEDGYTKFYYGEFKNGIPYGKGTIYYEDGSKQYEGDIPSGKGTFYEQDTERIYYVGENIDGIFEGFGTFYQSDGIYYVGEFKNGKYDGEGTVYAKTGDVLFTGIFKDNELISSNLSQSGNSSYSGYDAEYQVLIEWANEEVQNIYDEAQEIYDKTYEKKLKEAYAMYGIDSNSDPNSFAYSNAMRQVNAMMPNIKAAAEIEQKAYEAENLETLAYYVQSKVDELKVKYNIKD